MAVTKVDYRELESKANGQKIIQEGAIYDSISLEHFQPTKVLPLLHHVNEFISIKEDEISAASGAYEDLADIIVKKLNWPRENIKIHPQGSASSSTLIRSPNSNERFDIDAICEVDHLDAYKNGPIAFFENIGHALEGEDFEIEMKKRCWRIQWRGKGYYIDLTPAVKSNNISLNETNVKYFVQNTEYSEDAVWVVNEPTREWFSSNPRGFNKWISDRNLDSKFLIISPAMEMLDEAYRAEAEPVPDQAISLQDNLLLAIRLFKRHRDIKVKRNLLSAEFKPISVIITTLLGQCVNAMRENGRSYSSIVELLEVLSVTLPKLVYFDGKNPIIPNPTAEDENFADRWLEDDNQRMENFFIWTESLRNDLKKLAVARDDSSRLDIIKDIFGCSGLPTSPEPKGGNPLATAIPGTPSRSVPDKGLA
jgi:hypothetical protein